VRIDIACHFDQRAHRFGLEILDLETPGFGRVDQGRARNDQRGADTGEELAPV
jgi:hypothetical protein